MNIFRDELAKKIDSYALGVVFIYILGRDIQLGKIRIRKDNQNLLSSIIGLLEKMTHANPFERYDSIEAFKKYTEITNKMEGEKKIIKIWRYKSMKNDATINHVSIFSIFFFFSFFSIKSGGYHRDREKSSESDQINDQTLSISINFK